MKYNLQILPLAAATSVLLAACASIGRPEGGPVDNEPPVFVSANPMPGSTGVDRRTLTLQFDENVQLDDPFNKVVVSPVQTLAPTITANGRRITVSLRDSLIPNTTYTIDFGDAVKDLNEGNILDGFAVDFSTGSAIDTLRISGLVVQASNLEPAQDMIVAAYSNLSDSAIRTLRPDRIARTDQYGHFTIRNLAQIPYRIYALRDLNRDFHWDRSEDIAWLDSTVTPTVHPITVTDTLLTAAGADSLISRTGVQYLPNDILLTWFNEDYRAQYLKDYRRIDARRASVILGAPPTEPVRIRAVGGVLDGQSFEQWSLPQYSAQRDSLTLWLSHPDAIAADSLMLAVTYQRPDSTDRLCTVTDTLRFFTPQTRRKPSPADAVAPRLDTFNPTLGSSSQDLDRPFAIAYPTPVATLDTAAVKLETLVDTLWTPVAFTISPNTLEPLLGADLRPDRWQPGAKYRISVDSTAIVDIYGAHNPPLRREFSTLKLEDYSSLTLHISGADTTAVAVLLNTSDIPVAQQPLDAAGTARFAYLKPGTYYARLYIDSDRNGQWSTGILDSLQPEEVAYYPAKIELKRNWDVDQNWDIYAQPLDQQKPKAILKNKPKTRRGQQPDPEEDLNGEENDDPMLNPNSPRNPVDRRRPQKPSSTGMKMGGGFRQSGTN